MVYKSLQAIFFLELHFVRDVFLVILHFWKSGWTIHSGAELNQTELNTGKSDYFPSDQLSSKIIPFIYWCKVICIIVITQSLWICTSSGNKGFVEIRLIALEIKKSKWIISFSHQKQTPPLLLQYKILLSRDLYRDFWTLWIVIKSQLNNFGDEQLNILGRNLFCRFFLQIDWFIYFVL